eukprot:CAMPEP_0170617614 /NCGR_PEP_ID=MMETSP0224-20130122/26515_1 /TAXON_ID=285029 /ORGANISM="Togula jolla, Strain CCCM 725" /LENGTH=160 /DNA_ID=CAMNT_0010943525 /DNA_START=13 /DNA_END=496 /DNA_ORIENTATION=-
MRQPVEPRPGVHATVFPEHGAALALPEFEDPKVFSSVLPAHATLSMRHSFLEVSIVAHVTQHVHTSEEGVLAVPAHSLDVAAGRLQQSLQSTSAVQSSSVLPGDAPRSPGEVGCVTSWRGNLRTPHKYTSGSRSPISSSRQKCVSKQLASEGDAHSPPQT